MNENNIYTTNSKIKIKCKKHNYIFEQYIFNHLKGDGCRLCGNEQMSNKKMMNLETFLKKANLRFDYKFDYKLVKDLKFGTQTIIKIICKQHGIFEQKVCTHLRGKQCCPDCKKEYLRKKRIKELKNNIFNGNQVIPNFNPNACKILDKINENKGIKIQHAMNGGEFYIKELGYWVDGYDKENNIVYEFDEKKHFDKNGNLKEKDVSRQKEIEKFLKCKFIRIKYNEI